MNLFNLFAKDGIPEARKKLRDALAAPRASTADEFFEAGMAILNGFRNNLVEDEKTIRAFFEAIGRFGSTLDQTAQSKIEDLYSEIEKESYARLIDLIQKCIQHLNNILKIQPPPNQLGIQTVVESYIPQLESLEEHVKGYIAQLLEDLRNLQTEIVNAIGQKSPRRAELDNNFDRIEARLRKIEHEAA